MIQYPSIKTLLGRLGLMAFGFISPAAVVAAPESANVPPNPPPLESMSAGTPCLNCEKAEEEGGVKTIFEWALKPKQKKKSLLGKQANGEAGGEAEEEGRGRLTSDRPDFTEASSTVGKGVFQLEAGVTYFDNRIDGVRTRNVTYPEALLRIGMFADWFELRLGQNFQSERVTQTGVPRTVTAGAQDFYLGCKLALTEQVKYLPETALILQTTIPTGADQITANQVLPGFNYLFAWEVSDSISFGGSFSINRAIDDDGEYFGLVGSSVTVGYTLAERLTAYTEFFALHPMSSNAPGNTSTYFFDGGFQFFLTDDFAIDIRGGLGLSRQASDFLGVGFVTRY